VSPLLALPKGSREENASKKITPSILIQHPLSEAPAISLRFAEPPSVEGTGGGQMGEGALGAVAVVLAACVDVPFISPGNSKGD
jgi:hypothetical protein